MQLAFGFQLENMEIVVSVLEQVLLYHDPGSDRSFTGWASLCSDWLAVVFPSAESFHTSTRPQMLYGRWTSTPGLSLCRTPKQTRAFMTMFTWSCSELRGTCTYLASLSSFGCECILGNNHSTQLSSHSFSSRVLWTQHHASDIQLVKPGCCNLRGQYQPADTDGQCSQGSPQVPGGQPAARASEPRSETATQL